MSVVYSMKIQTKEGRKGRRKGENYLWFICQNLTFDGVKANASVYEINEI